MRLTTYRNGKSAEDAAACFLEGKGFTIEKRNVRFGRAEIDIIARNDDLLVFVEVKMRSSDSFGYGETFVSPRQQELYHEAATSYVELMKWDFRVRFDVVVLEKQEGKMVLRHFEDAF